MASSLSSIRRALFSNTKSLKLTQSINALFGTGCQEDSAHILSLQRFIHSSSQKDDESGRGGNTMSFVRGILDQDRRNIVGSPRYSQYNIEQNADIVNIKLLRNNAFVTVTDSKGNKKIGASSGSLPGGAAKASRYSAEAAAEHVGRLARNLGIKAVVVRVNGFIHFKKKRQAIMAFKEGFNNSSRGDQNPIVYIEDTTRKPHNGCRLPRQRRI